ncbi:MAG: helicase-related protein [Gammaproteobacteria bacterium]|nr:helicase-related protein [Gammaproteobacteria bacterium]
MDETNQKHILDNYWGQKVSDHLRKSLPDTNTFRIVSAYFSIFGFQKLQSELEKLNDVRFLFGNPDSVGVVDPKAKGIKSFSLTEEGLSLNHILQQRNLARRCEEWVQKDEVQIRSIIESNFLHGKMYLTEKDHNSSAIVGSSNFTLRGLGGTDNANIEINIATSEPEIYKELELWFDKLWNDQDLAHNVKEDVLIALKRIGKDYSPELIYYKTLFELFYDEIDRRNAEAGNLEDINLYDTKIWQKLYDFQKEGAKSAIERLQNLNGCILADSVGLGKTYTALAVIKFFELKNQSVLVLCPKRLQENWSIYPSSNNQTNNPFLDDRFNYTLLSHTDLTRASGNVGNINLGNFNWGNYDLIVIDESHNFRTGTKPVIDENGMIKHSRYSKLLEDVIKSGLKTKVLMLSATPVNTSLMDLKNQLNLATEGRDDVFKAKLGITNIGNVIIQAQKKFKEWEKNQGENINRNKSELLDNLGTDFFQLLGGISIARSKQHIKKYYEDELSKIGQFPTVKPPENYFPNTDQLESFSYEQLAKEIGEFSLSIYQPTEFLQNKAKQKLEEEKKDLQFNQSDRERALLGMIRTNFLKRLESSTCAMIKTLDRTIDKIDNLLEKINRFQVKRISSDIIEDIYPDDDEDDEDYFVNKDIRNPYHFNQLNLNKWKKYLEKDRKALSATKKLVSVVSPSRDGKLQQLREIVRDKVTNPKLDQDNNPNRKLLIFTTFKDTAVYLYENLNDLAVELNINMALVSGDFTNTTVGDNNFNSILSNFSPRSKGIYKKETKEVDLLIATDCISEGQNLQDCDMVLNYDIHWNPVRIIQRFGRIDRIGSRNRSVRMVNFWPVKDMDVYLRLGQRVWARMALVGATAGGDDLFSQGDNAFREDQLRKLRDEVIDLDDLSNNVVMSDFTLDDFLAQLLKFLENNKKTLEEIPLGSFSLTKGKNKNSKGVIFVLRQKNVAKDKNEKTASPLHPYYLTHIDYHGHIRISCVNAKKVLELFQLNTSDQSKPLKKLCDLFDAETNQGQEMSTYNYLLERVIKHISKKNNSAFSSFLTSNLLPDFKLPIDDNRSPMEKYEIITWLVIK